MEEVCAPAQVTCPGTPTPSTAHHKRQAARYALSTGQACWNPAQPGACELTEKWSKGMDSIALE